jgi:hypothetical protein
MTKSYTFTSKLWLYSGDKAAWHFITVPEDITREINHLYDHKKRGWGSLPVQATIGKTTWKTSMFPDKKTNSFLLPVKASIRKLEKIKKNDILVLKLQVTT